MSLLQTTANIKKGQSVVKSMIEQAEQSPDKIIAYIESLPEEMQVYVREDGNLLNRLYQVALKSRSMTALKSA
jgi:hypothetical protein